MTFKTYTLSELVTIKYGKNQKKVFSENGTVPIYGTGGLMGYATDKLYDKPSVLIGRKGTIGKVKYVEHPFWTVDTLFYTIVNEKIIIPRFLYYVMSQIDLNNYNEGTTIPSLRTETLNRIELNIPSISEQQHILGYLSILDEKIANNNAINENLEKQIQAIFLKIFPDVLNTDSDNTLESIITFSNGKKRPLETGNIPVYGGNGVLAYTNSSNSSNCVIIGRVGAYCGNTFLCTQDCWVSDNAIQAISKTSDSQLFIYYLLKNASIPSRHIGTGQPLMTQGILNAIPCVLPNEKDIITFIDLAEPMQREIDTNIYENTKLSSLRDILLPKLMSGEIDISEITI